MTVIEFNRQLVDQQLPLRRFAYSLTMNGEEAQDLVQDTFMKALYYRERFMDATNLKAWLYTIMKNTFINNYRKAIKTRQLIHITDDLSAIRPAMGSGAPGAESLIREKQIRSAIDALQEDYRIPFTRYFDGYKYKEIADELQLPIGTVKSRIFLARKKLMAELKELAYRN